MVLDLITSQHWELLEPRIKFQTYLAKSWFWRRTTSPSIHCYKNGSFWSCGCLAATTLTRIKTKILQRIRTQKMTWRTNISPILQLHQTTATKMTEITQPCSVTQTHRGDKCSEPSDIITFAYTAVYVYMASQLCQMYILP